MKRAGKSAGERSGDWWPVLKLASQDKPGGVQLVQKMSLGTPGYGMFKLVLIKTPAVYPAPDGRAN